MEKQLIQLKQLYQAICVTIRMLFELFKLFSMNHVESARDRTRLPHDILYQYGGLPTQRAIYLLLSFFTLFPA